MLKEFKAQTIGTSPATIFTRRLGSGPPLLLLHGFPETHLMWRDIAPRLAREFTVVLADLRGYGASGCPPTSPDHAPYSKRAMAGEMVDLMHELGFEKFAVVGHDRGGRVAYRMALDHPRYVSRLAVLDIVPSSHAWDRADAHFALAFWPWALLAQDAPLPETLLAASPEAIVDDALNKWGTAGDAFPAEVRSAYIDALRDPAHAHAICEEYRAAATLDRRHETEDIAHGRKIECPLLALWDGDGALSRWYENEGGPLALWKTLAKDVQGGAMEGGHFFPESQPAQTAEAIAEFMQGES